MEILKNTIAGQAISGNKKIIFNAGFEASLEYAEPKSCISPEIQLLFSPFGLPFVPIEIIGTNVNKIVTNFQWTKDRTNPGGLLQFTITPDKRVIQSIMNILNKFSFNIYSKIWNQLGVDLEDLFKPMTLCQLWVDGYHVMTGTVRAISRSSSVSKQDKQISYNIIIEELGNLYNQSTASLDRILLDGLQVQISSSIKKALALPANLKGVPVAQGIRAILNAFIATNAFENFTLSDGFPLVLRLIAQANPLGGIANTSIAQYMVLDSSMYELNSGSSPQSIWSFIQSFIPMPWMEFFTESGGRTMVTDGLGAPSVLFPGLNYVVARTTPYSNPLIGTVNPAYLAQNTFFDITALQMLIGGDFVIITDEMIHNKTLGIDSINQSTVFRTAYNLKAAVSGASDSNDVSIKSLGPLNPLASGGIPTFGQREMTQSIDCTCLIGLTKTVSYVERIAKNLLGIPGLELSKKHLSNLLAVWFRNQSRFREGTVTVRGLPYARPGMYCLYLPTLSGKKVDNIRDIGIYYIDSLDHSYSVENEDMSFTTTLNLIRGVPLPTSVAQTALLLFDYEILPPISGLNDSEYTILKNLRKASSFL